MLQEVRQKRWVGEGGVISVMISLFLPVLTLCIDL